MPGHKKHPRAVAAVGRCIGQVYNVNLAIIRIDSVDLDADVEVACDGDHLRVVALDVQLFYLFDAELLDIAHVVFEETRVLFQVGGSHEAGVHNYVVGLFVVAKHFQAMLCSVLLCHALQPLNLFHKLVVEVLNYN